jgi:uncharacterized membrane protein
LLLVGLVLFFAVHSVSIVNEPWRDGMVAKMGDIPWKVLYTVISIVGIVLIVKGYGQARLDPIVLYTPPSWMRHLAMLLLLPVFPLFLAAYFPGRIKSAAKHPMLLATKIWATAHLLVNGTLADVFLFGAFLAWAVADRISMKHRAQRPLPGPPASKVNDIIVVGGGLFVYVAFVLWLHGWVTGIPLVGM